MHPHLTSPFCQFISRFCRLLYAVINSTGAFMPRHQC